MKRTSHRSEDAPDICKQRKNLASEAAMCMEVNTEHRSNASISDDLVLECKHKIFLSHSGAQKEFVDHLCEALERRGHSPFFDRRHSSLPKGERFPELILKAAHQCQMAIVVVSEDYFLSKWPMIELHTFMQAIRQKSNIKLKVLPLFYGLSFSEFCDNMRRERWFNQWETWVKDDVQGRIKVNEWKDALDLLKSFNGMHYNRELKEIVAYRNDIVSNICSTILSDIKWDDSHVQGKSNICEVILEKICQIGPSQKCKVDVVGIYGVGGIGKTTICKTLCNELSREYEGRVCHVEFDSKNSNWKELLRKVLIDLTSTSLEVLQPLSKGHCVHMLREGVSKQRTFLAVDNVWDNSKSIEEAKMYLETPFHDGSLVIVTARSRNTLEHLGIDGHVCFEMPELEQLDAMNLFLLHAAGGKQFAEEDKQYIDFCIQRCYFHKGNDQGFHYHPLALKTLGLQLGCLGDKPSEWAHNLSRVRNFNHFSGENPVFDILRSNFDLLPPTEQTLFLDVAFYTGSWIKDRSYIFYNAYTRDALDMEWLCLAHKQDEDEIKTRLYCLKRKGLLQDVDLTSGRVSMHDLYYEFAELEVKGKLEESTDLEKRRWVYINNSDLTELESTPSGGCWHKLIRLGIFEEKSLVIANAIESLEGIEWQHFSNIVVLKLVGLPEVRGALNLEGLKCLRSLQLYYIENLDRLEGLEGLKNLTYFKWMYADHDETFSGAICRHMHTHVGQFPTSLKVLQMHVGVRLGPNVLARCKNLCKLVLREIRVDNLDLSNCSSLQSVTLERVLNLQSTLSGFTAKGASRLRSLMVTWCKDLVDIPRLDHLIGLEQLVLQYNSNFKELPDLQNLTRLQILNLAGPQFSKLKVGFEVRGLCIPRQLRVFSYWMSESTEAPNLNGLQVLKLSSLSNWTCLDGLRDMPALQQLELSGCSRHLRLPDLSMSRILQKLCLSGSSGVELHEEDICMLARLPLLQGTPKDRLNYNVMHEIAHIS